MKLFGQHIHAAILVLALAEYLLAALAFGITGAFLVGNETVSYGLDSRAVLWIFAFSTAVLLGLTAVGLYQPKQRLRLEGVVVRLVAALGLAAFVLALFEQVFPIEREGVLWAVSFLFSFVLLSTTRLMFGQLVDHEAFRRRVLIYGAGRRAASLLKLRRRSDHRGFRIVAFVAAPADQTRLNDPRVVDASDNLLEYARLHDIDEIVVAMDERRVGFPLRDLLECRFSGIAVIDLLGFLERETGMVKVDLVNPAWLIFSEDYFRKGNQQSGARVLNVVIAAMAVVVTLPLWALIAIAILLEDGAPLLYRQQRVGFGGKPFTLYKFRSMVKNAESAGPQWAGAKDPRVTRVGRVIRKLRLDELPQLFNVLTGDMNIVGPRPERPEFVGNLVQTIPYYQQRHSVKPGITGWAQLRYPYGSSEEDAMEKLQFDLYYVKHRSVVFDLMVMLQTVEVVLWGKGAR